MAVADILQGQLQRCLADPAGDWEANAPWRKKREARQQQGR
ncbi:hypothetical protein [Mesorhizobium carmichaelinearum]|nr:hypothetical protein [Mesorhizobium carmichaelinearum]